MPSRQSIPSSFPPGVSSGLVVLAVAVALTLAIPARAQDPGWPRQFDSPSGSFVIYQPQPEELAGDELTGRAAFSLQKSGDSSPIFGVLWYTGHIAVDRDSLTVTTRDFNVTRVRLPGITPEMASTYERLLETQAVDWDLSGSLEELQAGLAAAEQERASIAGIDNAPPRIVFHERRAILVLYDGMPVTEPIQGSDLRRVANTPYAVVFDPRHRYYYLNGANLWYRANDPLGPWSPIQGPPAAVRDIVPPDTSAYDQVQGAPPEVLTATEPTELISTDGPPRYAPLVGDELLYISNTESDVIREVSTQALYVLISGRWFRGPSTDGPWTYVRGDRLPASFEQVPADSPKGHILASVAGTEQAEDAIADAEIPQTSAIRRGGQGIEVQYDGYPQFAPIEGTELQYAMNTDAEVLLADGHYYACDQGVWFVSDYADGPWSVSDTRPIGVENIPPSCPVYDVRYVYVYDSTPEVVYVGYLPGYLGCYPYYGTVIYGTGYQYNPWRTRYRYIPRRFTWGFHARYNPWLSRWSFGPTYDAGFLRVGTRWRAGYPVAQGRLRSLWFGPGGYRRPLVARDMTLLRTRRPGGTRLRPPDGLPTNVYSRPENVARVDRSAVRVSSRSVARPFARPAPVPNDVFAGKNGSVYRRDPAGTWQRREGTTWKPAELPSRPPATQTPVVRERATVPSTGTSRPEVSRERDRPSVQAPAPQRTRPAAEQPPQEPAQPRERPTPPPPSPSPGDLEREYRARERSGQRENPGTPPQDVRPTPPRQEPDEKRPQEPPREKAPENPREKPRPNGRR